MSLISPDTKKKKIALPSVLSNIRNAVGRAGAEEKGGKSEVEIRPLLGSTLNNRSNNDLVGVGKSSKYAADRSQMRDRSTGPSAGGLPPPPLSAASSPSFGLGQSGSIRQTLPTRNAPSASSVNNWSATLQTYSERIGSQWRKRNRRDPNNERRRHSRGVTINTQPILIVLTLFFIGVPILITLFLLARKAVFGDEGVDNVATHEVPAHEVVNYGIDNAGAVVGEEADGITAAQVWNDLKQLTSEDNPLGAGGSDEIDKVNANGGSDNDVDVNEAEATNEEISNNEKEPVTNDVAAEIETLDNASNLRGSKAGTKSSQDVDQQDSPKAIDQEGALNSNVEYEKENQSAPVLESEEKTNDVDSTVEEVIADTASMADEKVINSGSTDVDIVVEEDEKSVTNNPEVLKLNDAEN